MREKIIIKQIVLGHPVSFTGKVIQEFLAEHDIHTYLLAEDEVKDFCYLLEDLSPDVFLIHESMYRKYKDLIDKQLDRSPTITCGLILEEHGTLSIDSFRDGDSRWQILITSPYDPAKLYFDLTKQLVK